MLQSRGCCIVIEMLKSHRCGELRPNHVGQEVSLAGWVHRRRDHGGLIFIDLRDHNGLAQIVFSSKWNAEAYAVADSVRNEYVVRISGIVQKRPKGTENDELPTGAVEVHAETAELLNGAKTPPFYVNEETDVEELLRLRYRYLDLRRERLHGNLVLRDRVVRFIRKFLHDRDFTEIETPILTKPTPEGARDYLVPSRIHAGQFYALPQSPQQWKQILMVAGFERYFQVAHCLRDEDLRADRQPEHTQLDLEMSFISGEDDIITLAEELYYSLVTGLFPEYRVAYPFPRLTYAESMRRFGTDKPDLRYGLELIDFTDLVAESRLAVLSSPLASGGVARGLRVPGGAEFSRKQIDDLTRFVQSHGAKGLLSFVLLGQGPVSALTAEEVRSPVGKYFSSEELRAIGMRAGAERGDLILLLADKDQHVNAALDPLRRELADRMMLTNPSERAFAFVTEYPLFERMAGEEQWTSSHHPFTAPYEQDISLFNDNPGAVRSRSYDLVCNGWELLSGSVRIHSREMQEKVFARLGIGPEEAKRRFGHLLEAFEYGAPPHAGFGAGLDRLLAVLTGCPDIREVIAFPKTKSAVDPLSDAPDSVHPEQLEDLHLRLDMEGERLT